MSLKLAKWFFLMLIVSLPLVRPFNLFLFDLQVPYTDLIFLAAFGFWVLAVILKQTPIRFDRLFIFVGVYALTFTISTVFSVDQPTSFHKLLGEYYLFALCFLTFNLVQDISFLKHVTIGWLIGTGLTILASAAGFALFYIGHKTQASNYFLSHFGSLPYGNYPRIHALFANANMLCNFLNVSIMLTILAAKLGWIKRKTAIIIGFGIMFSAVFSISPGLGGIALSVGLWFWAVFSAASKRTLAVTVLACGAILAAGAFATTLISPDTANTSQEIPLPFIERKFEPSVRVLVWENAIETIRQHPLLGIGTGVDVVSVQYEVLSGDKQMLHDAHNMWLNIFAQTGLLGLAALLLLCSYLIKVCPFRLADNSNKQYICVVLSLAFAGAFLYQGLNGSYEDARHLWVLIGLIVASSSFSENDILPASTEL